MTVITVIGTSHVAAVRQGWSLLKEEFPGIDLRFFAAPSGLFQNMTLDADLRFGLNDTAGISPRMLKLLTEAFGGPRVNLPAADAVIRMGWWINENAAARLLADFDCDGTNPRTGRHRLSRVAFQAFASAFAAEAIGGSEWHGWMRNRRGPRLFAVPIPRPAESCMETTSQSYDAWRDLLRAGGAKAGLAEYHDMVREALAPKDITLLTPPDTVYGESGLTDSSYTKGSLRLFVDTEHDNEDHLHMNAAYGVVVLRAALKRVLSELAGPVARAG